MMTPFSDLKTNEMSDQQIENVFVSPQNIEKIYTSNAAFVEGHRGTGKTILMRYIERHPKIDYNKVLFLGVYLRFDRTTYSPDLLAQNNDLTLFSHYITIILLIKLIKQLRTLFPINNFENFCEFSNTISRVFYQDVILKSFDELNNLLEDQRNSTMKYIRNRKTNPTPIISDYSGCFERIIEVLHKEKQFSNLTILFLLDEFENLNASQQSVINSFIKAAEYGYTFKVFHRPYGKEHSQILDTNEYLKERDDYIVLDFYEDIIGGDKYFSKFMIALCEKRLEYFYNIKNIVFSTPDIYIYNYLEDMDDDREFDIYNIKEKYVRKVCDKIEAITNQADSNVTNTFFVQNKNNIFKLRLFLSILEKKTECLDDIINNFNNETKKYLNWVHNYKKAILYLVCYENNNDKLIAGFESIISISGKITRYVLNILHYIFINDVDSNESRIFKVFSPKEQTEAILKVSDIAFKDIKHTPNIGPYIKELINYIGSVFLLYHKDSTLKQWEVNHFVIASPINNMHDEKIKKLQDILKATLTWGFLTSEPNTKAKNKNEFVDRSSIYLLHPIFSSYFSISRRKKQKCYFPQDELYNYIFGDLSEKKKIYQNRYKKIFNKEIDDWTQQLLFKGIE